MKKVFIDTNILIDLLADRRPYSKNAIEIFELAENGKIEIFMTSLSFMNTHYALKKYVDDKTIRLSFLDLLHFVKLVDLDNRIIIRSLKSNQKDFEDAVQMHSAYSISDINCLITRNTRDFKECEIDVFTPEEFLDIII